MKEKRMEREGCEFPAPETLFTAALFLATNYARSGCPLLCRMVMRQLACIQAHPDESVAQAVRDTCKKLQEEWGRIAAERALALREAATAQEGGLQQYH